MDDTPDSTSIITNQEYLPALRQAVEINPASIIITDTTGNILYVNHKFESITGYTIAEVHGKNPRILKSGELNDQSYENLWDTITTGKTWVGDFHNKKKNGDLYWEHATISPIMNAAGTITHFLAIKEDINERKLFQETLEQIYQLSANLICVANTKGYFTKVNPAFTKVLGFTEQELLTQPIITFVHPEDITKTNEELRAISRGETHANFENRYRTTQNTYVWLSWNAHPMNGGTIYAIATDITEKKNIETLQRKKQLELERINQLMIGRELKMIELKKENSLLQQQILALSKKHTTP